jgi:hypothetical protein
VPAPTSPEFALPVIPVRISADRSCAGRRDFAVVRRQCGDARLQRSAGHMGLVILATFVAFGLVFFGTIPLARQLNRVIASPASSVVFNRVTAVGIALASFWLAA